MVDDNVIFKKATKNWPKVQTERLKFGENWVYAYELPYNLEKNHVEMFIKHITKDFGKISEYLVFPYKNMLEHDRK